MKTITEEKYVELYDSYYQQLYRRAFSLLNDHGDASDVVHETFKKLSIADYSKIEEKLAPWLFTVCRNTALKLRVKLSRNARVDPIFFSQPNKPSGKKDTKTYEDLTASPRQANVFTNIVLVDPEQLVSDSCAETIVSRAEEKSILNNKLTTALKRLTEKQRNVVHLRFFENMDYKQIGETLNLSVGNVGFILCTATAKLRDIICKS